MTDVLVGFLAFLVFQQATTLGLKAVSGRMLRGRSWFLLPTVIGFAALAISLFSHLAGSLRGQGHATSDVDSWIPGTPSPWVILLVAAVGTRVLIRCLKEATLAIYLVRASRASSTRLDGGRLALRVHESDRLRAPFVRGIYRPILYVHRDLLESLSPPSLQALLLHETCHARRGDHRVAWIHSILVRPLDLLRLLAPLHAAWRDRVEHVCDDFAARRLGSGVPVAQAIVDVLRFVHLRPESLSPGPAFVSGAEALRVRVTRLLARDHLEECPGPGMASASWAGGLLLVGACAAFASGIGLELYCLLEHVVGMHCVP